MAALVEAEDCLDRVDEWDAHRELTREIVGLERRSEDVSGRRELLGISAS